jgi:hypothetical protein
MKPYTPCPDFVLIGHFVRHVGAPVGVRQEAALGARHGQPDADAGREALVVAIDHGRNGDQEYDRVVLEYAQTGRIKVTHSGGVDPSELAPLLIEADKAPVKVGDWLEIAGHQARVNDMFLTRKRCGSDVYALKAEVFDAKGQAKALPLIAYDANAMQVLKGDVVETLNSQRAAWTRAVARSVSRHQQVTTLQLPASLRHLHVRAVPDLQPVRRPASAMASVLAV